MINWVKAIFKWVISNKIMTLRAIKLGLDYVGKPVTKLTKTKKDDDAINYLSEEISLYINGLPKEVREKIKKKVK